MRPYLLPLLSFSLASCAHSQPAPVLTPPKLALNTLIISGGPSKDYNQYAIESNARYVEKLTAGTSAKRVLFADGRKATRSIVTQQTGAGGDAETVFAWLFDIDPPEDQTVYRASTLKRIDGPSTKSSIVQKIGWLSGQAKNGQKSLLYFTGHGSAGQKRGLAIFGGKWSEDYDNTTYALWGDSEINVHEVAGALKTWPAKTPLVLVMVQCHAGGFGNLMFEGGDPTKPLLDRDFSGFFAATGDRMASGCTPEVDETDYQDFTTHFFAALSGISRDGQRVPGADYDKNGAVSMLEAMAWTNLHDNSIDVPVCTSDVYLRTLYPQSKETAWLKTPYSTLLKSAAPWQRATLEGLSTQLRLKGEGRIALAIKRMDEPVAFKASDPLAAPATRVSFYRLLGNLKKRFPGLKARPTSGRFKAAQPAALNYIRSQKADFAELSKTLKIWYRSSDGSENQEAQALRFVRACRTLILESRLQQEGTAPQKAAFARLRTSEGRNPLR